MLNLISYKIIEDLYVKFHTHSELMNLLLLGQRPDLQTFFTFAYIFLVTSCFNALMCSVLYIVLPKSSNLVLVHFLEELICLV